MWKKAVLTTVAILGICGWLSSQAADDPMNPDTPVQAENPPAQGAEQANPGPGDAMPPFMGQPAGQDNEIPRRVAREFAPWISAVIQEKFNIANPIFPIRKHAQETLEFPNTQRIFRKFGGKLNGLDLALIGGRGLGEQTGVLLFTITTESGPVAFKIYHYKFGNTRSVGKIEVSDDWADIEKMYLSVDPLQGAVIVPL
jgi:hypothetical protein